jgi:hypothetical protein
MCARMYVRDLEKITRDLIKIRHVLCCETINNKTQKEQNFKERKNASIKYELLLKMPVVFESQDKLVVSCIWA